MSPSEEARKPDEPAADRYPAATPDWTPALQLTGLLPALLGLAVLAGWYFEIPILKSVLPGAVTMKPNTATGLLCSGLSLLFLLVRPSLWFKRCAIGLALMVLAIAGATGLEYLLDWQLGIDELLFKDSTVAYNNLPGRMSPYTVFAFLCLGTTLIQLVRPVLRHWAWIGACIVTVIGVVTLLGYFWNANAVVTDQWVAPVAIHTGFGFILLGAGSWLAAKKLISLEQVTASPGWSIEQQVLIGFIISLLLLLGFGGYTYRSGIEYSQSARLVDHTQQVRIAINDLYGTVSNTEATQRNYLLTGKEDQLNYYAALINKIKNEQELLARLVADNPDQLRNLGELDTAIRAKLERMSHAIDLYQEGGLAALKNFLDNGVGIESTLAIHDLTERIRNVEEQLLVKRQNALSSRRNITLASLVLTLLIAATLLWLLYQGIRREMRARRVAESNLLSANRFLDAVVENIPNMLFIKEMKHLRFVRLNRAGEELLGYSREDLLGKSDYDFFPREQADFFTAKDREALQQGKVQDIAEESIHTRNNGLRILHTKKIPFEDTQAKAQYLLGISEDITVRKQTENEIKALNAALKQRATEVEAINKELEAFSYSISHDLRAPLRHIQGYVELLNAHMGERLEAEPRRYLDVIAKASIQMSDLIDGLLQFSRMGRVALLHDPVDLNVIVRQAIAGLEMESRERAIEWNIGPLPIVRGDGILLTQVFANLIGNAIKYTRPRQPAKIAVLWVREQQPEQQGWNRIEVRDNGVGFEMKYARKLFGVFQRLHKADEFEGSGIGLANVHRIITRHGGRIWAEAELDRGATFCFTLPGLETSVPSSPL